MSVREPKAWITGEEFGQERRRLLQGGFDDDSPELKRLWSRVHERDEYLWEMYAKPLIGQHSGEWAAVSLRGEVIIRPTGAEVHQAAREQFGPTNFVYGRLAAFRGYEVG